MKNAGSLGLLLAAGCSSFESAWEAARALDPRQDSVEGRWEGTWRSDATGHEGALRCIVTRNQAGGYDARYHASYRWCIFGLSFEYTIPMTVRREDDGWKFEGSAELSCWIGGGTYTYEGVAARLEFRATYRTAEDHGVFRLERAR